MRILATIPHYFDTTRTATDGRRHGSVAESASARVSALSSCITALHQQFDRAQSIADIARRTTRPANVGFSATVDLAVCTTGDRHLLADLDLSPSLFEHRPTAADPLFLGLECRALLRDRVGQYDYYCFLEDDLVIRDPWFFAKLEWFNGHVGDARLLQPHRYEVADRGIVKKLYVDGDLADHVLERIGYLGEDTTLRATVMGREIVFRRPKNPHSGCYFLNARQMQHFAARPDFLDRDASFIGPLESVATLGIVRAFQVVKPAPENANFLEIEHQGTGFIGLVRAALRLPISWPRA